MSMNRKYLKNSDAVQSIRDLHLKSLNRDVILWSRMALGTRMRTFQDLYVPEKISQFSFIMKFSSILTTKFRFLQLLLFLFLFWFYVSENYRNVIKWTEWFLAS